MTNYFRIEAPFPAPSSTVLLPPPEMGNNMGAVSEVRIVRMEDGSRRTFIKRGENNRRYRWSFTLTQEKSEEFQDFVRRYRGKSFHAVWRGRDYVGRLNLNPIELSGTTRDHYTTTFELVEQ